MKISVLSLLLIKARLRSKVKFFFKDFIYLLMRDTQRHRQREKEAPRREPDVGFDPGSPGSRPGPKAGAKPLRHPGIPSVRFSIRVRG